MEPEIPPFIIKDCAVVSLWTGRTARTLKELAKELKHIDESSIYHHVLGIYMRTPFVDPNSFATWARHLLHDPLLAERLAMINPSEFNSLEELRQEILEIVEERLKNMDTPDSQVAQRPFYFQSSQMVVFDTGNEIRHPVELNSVISSMSLGSIFYHFIDALLRNKNGEDDFRIWLKEFGNKYKGLIEKLEVIDPHLLSLANTRRDIAFAVQQFFEQGKP